MRWLVTRGPICVLALLVLAPRATVLAGTPADTDGDGYPDTHDNCLAIANPTQLDTDRDGFGNHCDPDYDNDGRMGLSDHVAISGALGKAAANLDLTGDGFVGTADLVAAAGRLGLPAGPSGFDPDRDGFAFLDNCLEIPNSTQLDTDRDGFGNHCDPDYDNDGRMGPADQAALSRALGTEAPDLDLTGDGFVSMADLVAVSGRLGSRPGPSGLDPDADGFAFLDNCIQVPNPIQLDRNGDGFGDTCDPDYDNDGTVGLGDFTAVSRAVGTQAPHLDLTGDGFVTTADVQIAEQQVGSPPGPSGFDTDADGFAFHDTCPDLANPSQQDGDRDGLGDACDPYGALQECVGSDWQPGVLPVVTASCDRDGAATCTAEDLNLALLECGNRGGCILQLLAETYSDVAINIYDGSGGSTPPHGCQPEMSHCLTASFPNGLVIQGHGSRSVLRSPVFSGGDVPYPVLRLYRRPDIRLRMRNLTLDGNKERQDSLTHPTSAWHHAGFETSNYFVSFPRNQAGCIHNVVAQNFLSAGLSFGDVENWVFEYNAVRDIGCHDSFTPCPGIRDTLPVAPLSNGYRAEGYGIGPGTGSADLIYRGNRLTRITKYSLYFKGSSDGSYLIDGGVMEDNRITDSGSRGIYVAGLKNGRISNNRVEEGRHFMADGRLHYDELSAFYLAGRVEDSRFADNQIRNNAGPAIASRAVGRGVVFARTTVSGGCRERNPSTCNSPSAPNPGMCFDRGEISLDQSSGSVRFEDTTIADSLCRFVLWSQPGVETVDIDLVGGTLESGPLASRDVGRVDYGAINVGGRGALMLDGGVVLRNKGKPEVDGVVLTYGSSTAVVKDAVVEGFRDAYHKDDYLGGGTFIFCDRDPSLRCR